METETGSGMETKTGWSMMTNGVEHWDSNSFDIGTGEMVQGE